VVDQAPALPDRGHGVAQRGIERAVVFEQHATSLLGLRTALDRLRHTAVQGVGRRRGLHVARVHRAGPRDARIRRSVSRATVGKDLERSDHGATAGQPGPAGTYSKYVPVLAPAPLAPTDEAYLWRRHAAGDRTARERIVEQYLRLARMLARRYARTNEPLEDLEQVACLGLVQAVDRFDPGRGVAFSSFAVPTILGELKRHFRDRTWFLRVPRELRESAMTTERAAEELAARLGRTPSAGEVAEATGMGLEQVLEAREAALAYRCESLDRPLHRDGDDAAVTLGDRLGVSDDGLRRAEQELLLQQLASALRPREREILRLRFAEDLLQREIAERVGLSQMHVSRILRDGVTRLREQAQRQEPPVGRETRQPHHPS
jgi:RNA polymerase sigma-B factor